MAAQPAGSHRVLRSTHRSFFIGGGVVLGIAALVLIGALVASGGGGEDKSTTVLDERDRGASISLAQGEKFGVSLPSNTPTGFEWSVANNDDRVLTFLSSDYDTRPSNATGGGGTQYLRFSAVQAGQTTLELKYWLPSEGDASIRDRYLVTVTVTEE